MWDWSHGPIAELQVTSCILLPQHEMTMSHRPPHAAPGSGRDGPSHAAQSGGRVARAALPPRVVPSAPIRSSCCQPPACVALSPPPRLPGCPLPACLPCIIHRPLLLCCLLSAIPCMHPHTLLAQSTTQSCHCKRDNIATIVVAATFTLQPTNLPSAAAHCWVHSIPAVVFVTLACHRLTVVHRRHHLSQPLHIYAHRCHPPPPPPPLS